MRPSDALGGLPPQFEIRTEAEKWQGAQKQTQAAMREQGVMASMALSNNRALWETNKVLRQKLELVTETSRRLEHERNEFKRQLDAIPVDVQERAALQAQNDELRRANMALRDALAGSLIPEIDTDTRRAEMERLAKQRQELDATGLVPTPEEIARADHARDRQQGELLLDPASVRPRA